VYVKLTEKGILHIVEQHNKIMPKIYHISYNEYKCKADKNGFYKFQIWDLIDKFGGLSMNLYEYFKTEICL
jgi:hypothetical protein